MSTHFSYDAENRPIRRWYNSSPSPDAETHNTPQLPEDVGSTGEVKFFYDSQGLPDGAPVFARGSSNGRLVAATYGTGSSNGDYYGYDASGRPTLKTQQIGSVNYQVTATYNASGKVISQELPSGKSLSYDYDSAGRTLSFVGNIGDGTQRTYSTGMLYSPQGALTKEQFGTDTAIYNKRFYNSRGQLAEIRESTSYSGPNDTTWNRGAIINFYGSCWGMCGGSNSTTAMTNNNGNLKQQEVYVPLTDQLQNAPFAMWTQEYNYDSLNRLQGVQENAGDPQLNSRQEYIYDRFGNRRIHQSNTVGTGINKEFTVNTGNNRLGVPQGQAGVMTYDDAGNLTTDTYSGNAVKRKYDGENRLTSEFHSGNYLAGDYVYNAEGKRIRRTANGVETWQVYGMGGELLAEYPANGPAASPRKEYGHRNGELLIVAGTSSLSAPAPTALTAAPSGGGANVTLSWTAASGAANYRVERKNAGGGYVLAGTSPSNGFIDTSVTAGMAYLYKVCTADGAGSCTSGFSNVVLGTAFGFTDPTIVSTSEDPTGVTATPIRAVHINPVEVGG